MAVVNTVVEVAKGLAALHRKSPAAALTTTRWMVTMAPHTARAVALVYAAWLATPLRVMAIQTNGEVRYGVFGPDGLPRPIDAEPRPVATFARMVGYLANGDPGGAEAAWDALAADGTRWDAVMTLHELCCKTSTVNGGPITVVASCKGSH